MVRPPIRLDEDLFLFRSWPFRRELIQNKKMRIKYMTFEWHPKWDLFLPGV